MTKNYATPAQVLDAFESLSNANLLAIRKVASRYIAGTRYSEPNDLIYEALHRCLVGTRNWPLNVPFAAFLNETMKSLSHAERTCVENTRVLHLDVEGSVDALDHELMFAHIGYMNPDEAYEASYRKELGRSKIESLKRSFGDDRIAKILINAWANNVQTKDILAQHSISQKEFDAARKRIARRIEAQAPRRIQ